MLSLQTRISIAHQKQDPSILSSISIIGQISVLNNLWCSFQIPRQSELGDFEMGSGHLQCFKSPTGGSDEHLGPLGHETVALYSTKPPTPKQTRVLGRKKL